MRLWSGRVNWQTWRCRCGDNSVSTTLVTLVMVRCLGLAIWHAHLGGWLPACLVLTWPEPTGHLLQLLIRLHPPIMFRQIRLWPQALPPNIVTRMSQRSPSGVANQVSPSKTRCKFGKRCTRRDCWYQHPEGRNIDMPDSSARRSSRSPAPKRRRRLHRDSSSSLTPPWCARSRS